MTERRNKLRQRAARVLVGTLLSLLVLAVGTPVRAASVPTGFQEYYVVGDEQHVWDMFNFVITNEPPNATPDNAMFSVVSVSPLPTTKSSTTTTGRTRAASTPLWTRCWQEVHQARFSRPRWCSAMPTMLTGGLVISSPAPSAPAYPPSMTS